jgi:hypothetical protein
MAKREEAAGPVRHGDGGVARPPTFASRMPGWMPARPSRATPPRPRGRADVRPVSAPAPGSRNRRSGTLRPSGVHLWPWALLNRAAAPARGLPLPHPPPRPRPVTARRDAGGPVRADGEAGRGHCWCSCCGAEPGRRWRARSPTGYRRRSCIGCQSRGRSRGGGWGWRAFRDCSRLCDAASGRSRFCPVLLLVSGRAWCAPGITSANRVWNRSPSDQWRADRGS